MTESDPFTAHPFGTRVTREDIVDTMGFFDDWEDRYRYLIDLGRELPELPAALYAEEAKVKGCQSQVWLIHRSDGGRLQFAADSDALIVKGLLAIVLAACNDRPPGEILEQDMEAYFSELDLVSHLSPTRGNGLRAIVSRVDQIAQAAA